MVKVFLIKPVTTVNQLGVDRAFRFQLACATHRGVQLLNPPGTKDRNEAKQLGAVRESCEVVELRALFWVACPRVGFRVQSQYGS